MTKITSFDQSIAEQIGHYVYCLIDPRDNKVFYVGKGKNDRVFNHDTWSDEQEPSEVISAKLERISQIRLANQNVHKIILRHGLETDREAVAIEAAVIDFCIAQGIPLTNLQAGHGQSEFGLMSVDDIVSRYKSEVIKFFDEPAIVINIGRKFTHGLSQHAIYKHSHEAWVVTRRNAERAKIVIATAQGVVRGVFRIKDWYKVSLPDLELAKTKARFGFNGSVADELWGKYVGKRVPTIRGAANPVKYAITPYEELEDKYWFDQKLSKKAIDTSDVDA